MVDSAFNLADKPFLVKSSQAIQEGAANLVVNRDATSVRQMAEWGMRAIQASFSRLKDPLAYEEGGERKLILTLMVLLYNFQTMRVGINHIQQTFMPESENFIGDEYHP